jgi:hypothetical protein
MADERRAVGEMLRVTRKRLALGLLKSRSKLWETKGKGGYAGVRWHTPVEAAALLAGLPARNIRMRSAVALPDGGFVARLMELVTPRRRLGGAFLCLSAEPARA